MTNVRTEEEIQEGYHRYRGKCYEMCQELLKQRPELRLVRGHIHVPFWVSEPMQQHWWLEDPEGNVVDPTWEQFPFGKAPPKEMYHEFDGMVTCAECGIIKEEKEMFFESRHAFCSSHCYARFVGVL